MYIDLHLRFKMSFNIEVAYVSNKKAACQMFIMTKLRSRHDEHFLQAQAIKTHQHSGCFCIITMHKLQLISTKITLLHMRIGFYMVLVVNFHKPEIFPTLSLHDVNIISH